MALEIIWTTPDGSPIVELANVPEFGILVLTENADIYPVPIALRPNLAWWSFYDHEARTLTDIRAANRDNLPIF